MPKYINGKRLDPEVQRQMRREARSVVMTGPEQEQRVRGEDGNYKLGKNGEIETRKVSSEVNVSVGQARGAMDRGFTLKNKGDEKAIPATVTRVMSTDDIITEAAVRDIRPSSDLDLLAEGKVKFAASVVDRVLASQAGDSDDMLDQKGLKAEVAKTDISVHTQAHNVEHGAGPDTKPKK
jgi:hypothetical protein